MEQEAFNQQFRNRTKSFALKIIQILSPLKYTEALSVMRKQIFGSCTSVAANFRAVCRSRSEREKFSKLCMVVKEADETLFWLEMIAGAGYIAPQEIAELEDEGQQILRVMSAYKKKLEPFTTKSKFG